MAGLGDVQRALQDAILGGDPSVLVELIRREGDSALERIAIYRHHFLESLTDALAATYPITRRLVGEDFFFALTAKLIAAEPPMDPRLSRYGGGLAATIRGWSACDGSPYLADVARLEWALHTAAEADAGSVLDAAEACRLLQQDPERARLEFEPCFQLIDSAWPLDQIWNAHAAGDPDAPLLLESRPAWLQIAQDELGSYFRRLSAGEYRFRKCLLATAPMASALESACALEPELDAANAVLTLLQENVVARVRT